MFKGKKVNPKAMDTLIGEGTVFEGRIQSAAGVRIEGQLTGDIRCEGDVTVGEQGKVKSHIAGRDVVIAGVVHGNVTAKGKLRITSKGQLFGNVAAASFVIDEGAVFQGASQMEQQQGAKQAQPAAPLQQPEPVAAPVFAAPAEPQPQRPAASPPTAQAAPAFGGKPVVL
ncbi:bactofilin family protein [Paenibacillus cremeus]|uniref:bactofilin family protein n=1 Tax=Paenibacillus cremeus TaxID=2163881 RepID=UPI001C94AFCC|nr:polymer-forming cytoskeletal protein [Paenibacillus cremeus]